MLNKIKEILHMIRVIRFEFHMVIHVYREPLDVEFAPLGSRERVEQMSNKRNEFRMLHKEADTAYREQMRLRVLRDEERAKQFTEEREEEKRIDGIR